MKYFFDTEFYEDGMFIQLISIGIVAEDGRRYYAETDFAKEKCSSDWLKKNVRPHLTGEEKSSMKIAKEIIEFVGEKPEFWAYYADYDWVALCQLYGRMIDLPPTWPKYCRDVKQFCDSVGNPRLPQQESTAHNALGDALHTQKMYLFLRDRQRALLDALAPFAKKANEIDDGQEACESAYTHMTAGDFFRARAVYEAQQTLHNDSCDCSACVAYRKMRDDPRGR